MNKHRAIYSINPNIKRIDELDDNTFVCYDENGNSVETPSIETINAKKSEMISKMIIADCKRREVNA